MSGEPVIGLRVLVVDDERPALDELSYLLERDERVGVVYTAASATNALRTLHDVDIDAIFLDIQMPGMTGIDLARELSRAGGEAQTRQPPAVVFVTAHEEHAVDAFDVRAVDYVLKPVRQERLAEAVRRLLNERTRPPAPADEQVAVERAGVTRFLRRSEIRYVEAAGDYARLHTTRESYLLRTPLNTLETDWEPAGFIRAHRSLLVNLAHVSELRMDQGRCTVVVDGALLAVSRRHTRSLRERLSQRDAS